MAKTELHLLGIVTDLFYIDTVYKKDFSKYQGYPVFYNQGGLLYFKFPYGEIHARFLERMLTIDYELYKLSYPVDDGKIVFYDPNGDILKTWKFKDAPIVKYKVIFDPNGGGMTVEMILSPAIQDYGCKIHRSWHITPIKEETYQSPVYATEQKEKPIIETISWIDDKDEQKIKSAEFKETIRAFVKVTNIDLGKKVNLKLYAKSGGVFASTKFKEYEAEVIEKFGGYYVAFEIKLDETWKINKANPKSNVIDTIYGKATYENVSNDFSSDGLDIVTQKLKGIFLEKGNDQVYYYKGELYSATQDKKGMVLYTEKPRRQFRETKKALDIIYTKSIGKKFIDDICKRSNPFFITVTRKKGKNSTRGKTVSWSPGDNFGGLDVNGNTKRKPFISLAHELWHAWENWRFPNMPNPIWVNITDENRLQEPIYHKELTASEFENKIRAEQNAPKRKWYSYSEEENGTKTGIGKIF